jgi:hypothetical protein
MFTFCSRRQHLFSRQRRTCPYLANLRISRQRLTDDTIPANMDADRILHIGRVDFRNDDHVFGIKSEDRFLHVYVIGKTGTGKSTLIETMALQV